MTEINPENGHGAADDESPLNGTVVADTTPPSPGNGFLEQYDSLLNGTVVADTTPPPPGNGFLEQWAAWSAYSLKDLEEVCKAGLTPEERLLLFRNGVRLIQLASEGADDSTFKDFPELQKEPEDMAIALR